MSSSPVSAAVLPAEVHNLIIKYATYFTPYVKQHFEGTMDIEVIKPTNYIAQPLHDYATIDRAQLAALRLVNRSYHKLASPLFFQTIDISAYMNSLPYRHHKSFQGLYRFSQTSYAHDVRKLVIGTRGFTLENVAVKLRSYYDAITNTLLPSILPALARLEILTILSPEVTFTIKITSPGNRNFAIFLSYVVDVVFSDYIPFASHFHPLSTVRKHRPAIEQAPSMLESIIMDWQTARFDEADAIVRSDSQRYFPDALYEQSFFSFIAEASNLTHLCLRFGHKRKLILDLLDCEVLVNLKILELGGMHASGDGVVALLRGNLTSLRAVDLQIVQLWQGEWEEVFAFLETFPRLEYLFAEDCSYV